MNRVIIVQARMTSTRLPGKVLMDLVGRPMLERQLARLARCTEVDEIVLATTTNSEDEPLVELARRLGIRVYRGSEEDVLGRYVGASREARADLVVRVTSDCPLIDPVETDLVITALAERRASHDYASNALQPDLPRGVGSEALWADVLERIGRLATSRPAREHVTWFARGERQDLFEIYTIRRPFNAGDLRWTVDELDDLTMVRRLYEDLGVADRELSVAELINYVRAHPEIAQINGHVRQKVV